MIKKFQKKIDKKIKKILSNVLSLKIKLKMNLRHEESKSGSFKVLADQTPRVADNLLLPRRESSGRIHFRVTCAEDHGERPNGGSCAHHDAHFVD